MNKKHILHAIGFCLLFLSTHSFGQQKKLVRPEEIQDVLYNPGIGFTREEDGWYTMGRVTVQ